MSIHSGQNSQARALIEFERANHALLKLPLLNLPIWENSTPTRNNALKNYFCHQCEQAHTCNFSTLMIIIKIERDEHIHMTSIN